MANLYVNKVLKACIVGYASKEEINKSMPGNSLEKPHANLVAEQMLHVENLFKNDKNDLGR